ncbi:MAG TPA: CpsB/CapC family capsule biosynthesis tyrosine phosphatase [Edaphocola sp.]|nr:CpsB/CapC family capsule biosynthesis tyrosine phosphatase [Edaphocola sp.]
MFSIFNKPVSCPTGSLLLTDMHAHILPGIDDGAATVEEALVLVDGLISLGYQQLIATPHIMGDLYPNTPETIHQAYSLLKAEMDKRHYTIPLSYAAEYLIDEQFPEKIEAGLLTFNGNHVLVETMFAVCPPNIEEVLFSLQAHGYQPVFAHPERYHYMDESLKGLEPFQKHHCLFQPNWLSFAGYYGKREKMIAQKLLEAHLVNFLGTDMHHTRHLSALKHLKVKPVILRQLEAIDFGNRQLQAEREGTPEV